MRRALEPGIFLALAIGLHVAAAVHWSPASLVQSGPAGSGFAVAGGEMAALVASWQAAPDPQPPAPMRSPRSDPAAPRIDAATPPVRQPGLAEMPMPTAEAMTTPAPSIATARPRPNVVTTSKAPTRPRQPRAESDTAHAVIAASPSPPVITSLARVATPSPASSTPSPLTEKREASHSTRAEPVVESSDTDAPTHHPAAPTIAHLPNPKPARSAEPARPRNPQQDPKATRTAKSAPRADEPRSPQLATKTPATSAPPASAKPAPDRSPDGTTAKTSGSPFDRPMGAAGRTTNARTASASAVAAAEAGYVAAVRRAVGREKRYPRRAEARGITGRSTIRVTIDRAGRLSAITLTGSSGHAILDEAALRAGREARYPPIPAEIGKTTLAVTLPIRFERR